MKNEMKLFQNSKIRTAWDEEKEEWYFSVVDVVAVLSGSVNPIVYWRKLKQRLSDEGNETVTICHGLKMSAADGKMRLTDVADMKGILRIIQSIPSKNAEPFKMWLAEVGKERLDEAIDPELAIDRAFETYRRKGYSEEWIKQRILAIRTRKDLTNSWDKHGVKRGRQYAELTDIITKEWSGMTTRQYKNFKDLTKENLRDNMSTEEIVLNMLSEIATKNMVNGTNPQTMDKHRKVAKRGGAVASEARRSIEEQSGVPLVTSKNAHDFISEEQQKKLGE